MHATKHWGQNLYKVTFNFRVQYANNEVHMGAIGGKTGKTADLPKFCKIERVGGVLPCYRGFTCTVKKIDHSLKHVKTNLRFFGLS